MLKLMMDYAARDENILGVMKSIYDDDFLANHVPFYGETAGPTAMI